VLDLRQRVRADRQLRERARAGRATAAHARAGVGHAEREPEADAAGDAQEGAPGEAVADAEPARAPLGVGRRRGRRARHVAW
jgi:hypothetical protein